MGFIVLGEYGMTIKVTKLKFIKDMEIITVLVMN